MEIITKTIKEIIPKIKKIKTFENAEEYTQKLINEFDFKEDICVIENKYIVTKDGKVYTVYFNKKGIRQQKARKHSNGYLRATIYGKDIYIHRLVAMCFIPNSNNYKEISHEDNNKTNNTISNLKWCTRSYNNKKMFIDGIRTSEEMRRISLIGRKKHEKARNYI